MNGNGPDLGEVNWHGSLLDAGWGRSKWDLICWVLIRSVPSLCWHCWYITSENINHSKYWTSTFLIPSRVCLIETDIEVVDCVALRPENVIIFAAVDARSLFGGMVLHPAVKITADYCSSRKVRSVRSQWRIQDFSDGGRGGVQSSGAGDLFFIWLSFPENIKNGPEGGGKGHTSLHAAVNQQVLEVWGTLADNVRLSDFFCILLILFYCMTVEDRSVFSYLTLF